MADGTVVPNRHPVSPLQFHAALVAGLARVSAEIGRGNLADKSERTPKALAKLFSGDTMDTTGKGLLDFLLADPTALDEVLALYGYGIHRLPDLKAKMSAPETLGDVIHLAAVLSENRDNGGDHRAKLRIANAARPVAQAAFGFIAEADAIRGVAA